jgi:CBS domain-containing protein
MHAGVECIGERETLQRAAARMRELDVGALPICGDDDRLHGMVTDRDIVVKCVAVGGDPATMTAGELAQVRTYWIDANADLGDVLAQMQEHKIRRLPVIEEHRLVGIISEADLGRHLSEVSADRVGHFVEAVSA